jgi:hypothetical protein
MTLHGLKKLSTQSIVLLIDCSYHVAMRFCWRVKHPKAIKSHENILDHETSFHLGPFVCATWICLCSSWTHTFKLNMTILAHPTTSCYSCDVVLQYYKPYLILDRRHTFRFKLMDQYYKPYHTCAFLYQFHNPISFGVNNSF